MSFGIVLAVGALGGIGAVARFALDGAVGRRVGREFPYGTLAVNLLGALILGALAGAAVGRTALTLEGTGLIGGFTTFSTWVFESHRLAEDGELRMGLMNFVLSLILGVAFAWAGLKVGGSL